jgi:2-dehydropantoate 2-reductase
MPSPSVPATKPLRVAVFGVGAVGGFFGGRLAHHGQHVTFLARGKTLDALSANGLRVDSIDGNFVINPAQVTDDPAEIGEVDLVLLGVKAWQVPGVVPDLQPLLHEGTAVLPLQNGVEAPEQIAAELGERHSLVGLCKIISARVGPGHIDHLGAQPYVALGELDGRRSERLETIRQAFETAGIAAETPPAILPALWEKFLFITAVSGLGAVTRVTIGELRTSAPTRRLLSDAMQEVVVLALARGIELPDDTVKRTMAFVDALPDVGTTSMQRDIMEGLPSELDAQNGAVARMAAAIGVTAPINTMIYELLSPLEQRARSKDGQFQP